MVASSGREGAAVGAVGHAVDGIAVTCQAMLERAGFGIPELERRLAVDRGDLLAIGAIGNAVDAVVRTGKTADLRPGGDVP